MKAPSESLERKNRKKGSGRIELNKMTAIEAKLDAIMHKLGNQEKRMHSAHEIGAVEIDGIEEVLRDQFMRIPIKLRRPVI